MENLTFDNSSEDNSSWQKREDLDSDYSEITPVLYCVILATITGIGVTGNCLILVLFSTDKYSRQSFSVYVRSMAVSDSLVLTSTLTDDVISRLLDADILYGNRDICFLVLTCAFFFQVLSSILVLAVAADRYIAVVHPLRRASLCTFKRAIWLTLLIIIACLLLSLPAPIWNEIETMYMTDSQEFRCPMSEGFAFGLFAAISRFMLILFVPFCTIILLNWRSVRVIKLSLKNQKKMGSTKINSNIQIKVTLSLIAVTVGSVLVLLPIIIVEIIEMVLQWKGNYSHSGLKSVIDRSWNICNIITLVNYVQNFYIFVIFGREYRLALRKLFGISRSNFPATSDDSSVINSCGREMTSHI